MQLIALTGLKRAGKSTAAELLKKKLESDDKLIYKLSFATPIKEEAEFLIQQCSFSPYKSASELPKEQVRLLYQWLGDFGKYTNGPDYFIKVLDGAIDYNNTDAIIIDDLRFEIEAQWVRSKNGVIIRIVNHATSERSTKEPDKHVSETEQLSIIPDHYIYNNGRDMAVLEKEIIGLIDTLKL